MAEGLLMVYTGDSCDQYTSPLGQAFRALGRGLKVCVIEFVNRNDGIGLLTGDNAFDGHFEYHAAGIEPGGDSNNVSHGRENATKAIRMAQKIIESGEFDMVILDGLADVMATGMVDSREVLALVSLRPTNLNVIISGHSVTDEILQVADLITRVENIKPDSSCQRTGNQA